jgi:alcohol dehydrogenase
MVLDEPGKMGLQEFQTPDLDENQLLLEIEMTSVCGSDVELYEGELHTWDPPYPLILGHEIVGRVGELGPNAGEHHGVETGDRVILEPYIPDYQAPYAQRGYYQLDDDVQVYGINTSCANPPHLWGGYSDRMVVQEHSKLHPIDEDVPSEAACLSSVMGNGVRWIVDKADVAPGDSVVVVGPGVQGLASVLMAHLVGADPIVLVGTSSDTDRMELGKEYGATHTINLDETDPTAAMTDITADGLADVAVCSAPATSAIRLGIDLLAPLGTAVIVANTELEETPVVMDDLIQKEAQIIAGLGQSNNMPAAISVVERHADLVQQMISHVFPLEDAEVALQKQVGHSETFDESLIHAAIRPSGQ